MSGRDFDPFGSLGPINPQDPTDPKNPVDPVDPQGPHATQDPGAASGGDLAPWKPPARAARSPFTPVPGAPEGRTAREYPTAASAAAPVLPSAAAPVAGSQDPGAGAVAPEGDSADESAPELAPEAEAAPELMFFPVAGAAVQAPQDAAPIGFDAAMEQTAEPAELPADAEPAELPMDAESAADIDTREDPEFEDAAEFLKSLTSELEIDPEGLDDPRWASDPEPLTVADLEVTPAEMPSAAAMSVPEPELAPEPEPAASTAGAYLPSVAAPAAVLAASAASAAAAGAADSIGSGAADSAGAAAETGAAEAPTPILAGPSAAERGRGVRRWLPYAAAVVIPLLFGGAVWAASGGQAAPAGPAAAKPAAEAAAPAPADEGPIRVLAMGDMLPHDSVNQNAVQADGSINFTPFFDGIQPNLAGADAVFCNQEVPSAGVDFGISGYPTFNTYAEFSRDLRQGVGCNLVNLATNHSADKGAEGIAATRGQWDALDALSVSGANRSADEQNTIQYGEVRGVKTALVSFAEYSNAPIDDVSLNFMGDDALVERLLTEARANAQLVIVSAHWGTEDSHDVNDAQRAFAQRVADLGADVVLGTGPHVLQPVEWVPRADGGQTLVWYSLGNMLNTQLGVDQRTGIIASFEVVPGADGGPATVSNPSGVLTWMNYDWTPEEEAALQLDARHALSIQPLAASAEMLARTTYGVSVEQIAEQSAAILGPLVALSPGV